MLDGRMTMMSLPASMIMGIWTPEEGWMPSPMVCHQYHHRQRPVTSSPSALHPNLIHVRCP